MQGQQRNDDHPARDAMIHDATAYPIWCDHCGTDAFICIESARRRHWAPDHLDVTYFCADCDAIYGHLVKESEIKAEFVAAVAAAGRPHAVADEAGYDRAS